MILKFNRVLEVVEEHVRTEFHKAAVRELSCPQAFLPDLAMVKNPIVRSRDLDL